MDLNSTNINTILVNISCCIDALSKQLVLFSQVGNKKCFMEARNKILILDKLYLILKKNYKITYPIYSVNIPTISTNGALVTSVTLTDVGTNTILANGFNFNFQPIPLVYALNQLITNLQSSTNYTATFTYDTNTSTNSVLNNVTFTIKDYECPIDRFKLHIFVPTVDSPPYTGISPLVVGTEIGTYNLSAINIGNCTQKNCFTSNELTNLYQQALNMCGLCNCN